MKKIKGFKVTDANMKCIDYKFTLNTHHTHKGEVKHCKSGFHFCQVLADYFSYYDFKSTNRVFEIEAWGEVITDGNKSVCNNIKFIREMTWEEVLKHVNTGSSNTGLRNSGNSNSGNSNSGNRNSGNWNSGDSNSGNSNSGNSNSGNSNSGNSNSGYWNSGDSNSGNWNSGDSNSGDSNSGYRNSGDSNSGNRNSGNWNSGYWNSGDSNSGNWNSGDSNSGNWNSGNRNSGDSNSGYRNSGAFCTDDDPILYLFNKPTKIKVREWENHKAVQLMNDIDPTIWVNAENMSDEEKQNHPGHETTGGYLKSITMQEAWANAWHNWDEENKKVFLTLPNFDASIFEEITGIKVTS